MRWTAVIALLFFGQLLLAQNGYDFYDYIELKDSLETQQIAEIHVLYTNKDHRKAIKKLKQELADRPDFYNGHLFLGFIYDEEEKYEEAIKHYTDAIQTDPEHPFGYFLRGNSFLKMERYRPAQEDYLSCIRIDPYFYGAYNNMAVATIRNQDKAGAHPRDFILAKGEIIEILEKRPVDDKTIYFNLGFFHLSLWEFDEAANYFDKSLAIEPAFGKGAYYKALSHFYMHEYEEAYPHFLKAIENDYKVERSNEFVAVLNKIIRYLSTVREG